MVSPSKQAISVPGVSVSTKGKFIMSPILPFGVELSWQYLQPTGHWSEILISIFSGIL